MNIKLIFGASFLLLVPIAGQASTTIVYTDNAANSAYASGYAGNGAGTPGFGAFSVATTTTGGGAAGTFIGSASATENGSVGGALDTAGKSFGTFANGNSGGVGDPSVTVSRAFNIADQPTGLVNTGDAFSLDFATGYNDGVAGTSGVSLTNSGGKVGSFFFQKQNGTSPEDFYFNGVDTLKGYSNGILHLTYTLTSATTYSFASTGAITYSGTGTYGSPITGFLVQQTNSAGNNADHDAFFNNLSLTAAAAPSLTAAPEPSQMAAISFMVLGLGGLLVRRRQMRVN